METKKLNTEEKTKLTNEICELIENGVHLHNFVLTRDYDGDIDVKAKVYLNNYSNDEFTIISTLDDLGNYEVGSEFDQGFDNNEQLVNWWLFESDDPVL